MRLGSTYLPLLLHQFISLPIVNSCGVDAITHTQQLPTCRYCTSNLLTTVYYLHDRHLFLHPHPLSFLFLSLSDLDLHVYLPTRLSTYTSTSHPRAGSQHATSCTCTFTVAYCRVAVLGEKSHLSFLLYCSSPLALESVRCDSAPSRVFGRVGDLARGRQRTRNSPNLQGLNRATYLTSFLHSYSYFRRRRRRHHHIRSHFAAFSSQSLSSTFCVQY